MKYKIYIYFYSVALLVFYTMAAFKSLDWVVAYYMWDALKDLFLTWIIGTIIAVQHRQMWRPLLIFTAIRGVLTVIALSMGWWISETPWFAALVAALSGLFIVYIIIESKAWK